jgi:hypothetical protein
VQISRTDPCFACAQRIAGDVAACRYKIYVALLGVYFINAGLIKTVASIVTPPFPIVSCPRISWSNPQNSKAPGSVIINANCMYSTCPTFNLKWSLFPTPGSAAAADFNCDKAVGANRVNQSRSLCFNGRTEASRAFASARAFVERSYWCASSKVFLFSLAKSVSIIRELDSTNAARSCACATAPSILTPCCIECATIKNSIATPSATENMYRASCLWCASFSRFARPDGWWCKYHSPMQPYATSKAASSSKAAQNQNDGTKTNAAAFREIVATIPEIIFAVTVLFFICALWINEFSGRKQKC